MTSTQACFAEGYNPSEQEVYDLYPQPAEKEAETMPDPLRAPGESIDDSQPVPSPPIVPPCVITIEMG